MVVPTMKRIVAIGGGGFLMESAPSLLDEYLMGLTAVVRPRVCFVPTASGDAEDFLQKYYAAFARFTAELSHLTFFRHPRKGAVDLGQIEQRLGEQDLIYVGGGNTRSMLAVWREWGLPQALRAAYSRGTILAGVSAGAICWFEWGASDSASPGTRSGPLRCLGFLKGSCSPHWGGEVHRRRDFHSMVRSGALPPGYGIADGAALLFQDGRLAEAVSIDHAAGAYRVELSGDRLRETAIPSRQLGSRANALARKPLPKSMRGPHP
jgi:dipeptidase E